MRCCGAPIDDAVSIRVVALVALRGMPALSLPRRHARHLAGHRTSKTAPFFRLAATIGAVLTDLPGARRRPLEAALGSLGVAFQLVDDLLDDDAAGQASSTSVSRRRAAAVARRLARPASAIEGPDVLRCAFASYRRLLPWHDPRKPMNDGGTSSPPRVIGERYTLLDLLGSGLMGQVYRAHDAELGRASR